MSLRERPELLQRTDRFARWLIRQAARHAPPPLSQRLEEEWLADFAAQAGWLSRLRFGLGCCWAATVIVDEHCSTSAAAVAAGSYARHDAPVLSRRTFALLLVACVHTALIYALVIGVRSTAIEVIPPMSGELLPAPRPAAPQPRPPEPTLVPAQVVEVHPGEFPIDIPPEPARVERSGTTTLVPLTPVRPVNRILGGPGKGFPDSADYYPPASRRLAETGAAGVRVCVDVEGRLTTRPTIARSSGSMRLDDGALKLAEAGSGHYRPTTEEGRSVDSCYVFRIRFELR
jgi:periplasmic protein TonB